MRKQKITKINILGTDYSFIQDIDTSDPKYQTMDGWCDNTTKEIHIGIWKPQVTDAVENFTDYLHKVARHEIIHAFLYESGLDCNTHKPEDWVRNEEMVDWFAIQFPKIEKVFKKLNLI